jgi:hypothetical protein
MEADMHIEKKKNVLARESTTMPITSTQKYMSLYLA